MPWMFFPEWALALGSLLGTLRASKSRWASKLKVLARVPRFLLPVDKFPKKAPSAWMSVDMGFVVGATAKAAWAGAGAGVGFSCSVKSCGAYLSMGVMATVNIPIIAPLCVLGAPISPVDGMLCAQVVGGAISAFCCNFDPETGKHDCR